MGKNNGSDIAYHETGVPGSKSVNQRTVEEYFLDNDSDHKRRHPIRFLLLQLSRFTNSFSAVMKEKLKNAHFTLKKYVQMSISMIRLVCQQIKSKGHAMTNKTKGTSEVSTKSKTTSATNGIMSLWQFTIKIVQLLTVIGIFYGIVVIFQGTKDVNMVLPMVPAGAWALVTLVRQFTK